MRRRAERRSPIRWPGTSKRARIARLNRSERQSTRSSNVRPRSSESSPPSRNPPRPRRLPLRLRRDARGYWGDREDHARELPVEHQAHPAIHPRRPRLRHHGTLRREIDSLPSKRGAQSAFSLDKKVVRQAVYAQQVRRSPRRPLATLVARLCMYRIGALALQGSVGPLPLLVYSPRLRQALE